MGSDFLRVMSAIYSKLKLGNAYGEKEGRPTIRAIKIAAMIAQAKVTCQSS